LENVQYLVGKYKTLLESSKKKYGEMGIGMLMIRLQYLSFILKIQNTIDVKKEKSSLADTIIKHYNAENIPPSTLSTYISSFTNDSGELIYCFDPDEFEERYGYGISGIDEYIKQIDEASIVDSVQDGFWYIYVIDQNDNILIYNEPVSITELVLNRNKNNFRNIPIVHPILVHNRNLRVKAAGEITFVIDNDSLKGVVANTKSGHFRPHPSISALALKVISSQLKLPQENVVIIPVGLT